MDYRLAGRRSPNVVPFRRPGRRRGLFTLNVRGHSADLDTFNTSNYLFSAATPQFVPWGTTENACFVHRREGEKDQNA